MGEAVEQGRNRVTGRFMRGNKHGGGNCYQKEVAAPRRELFRAATVKDFREMVRRLVHDAKAGDIRVMTLVLNYTLGRPVAHVEATVQTSAVTPEEMRGRLDKLLGRDRSRDNVS